jgi:hypothetical protein
MFRVDDGGGPMVSAPVRHMFDPDSHFRARVAHFERDCVRAAEGGGGPAKVVFLGDSLVEGAGRWMGWVNRGVGSDHLTWPEQNVFARLGPGRLHPNPSAVVVLIGINDLADRPTLVREHTNAYGELLTQLNDLHPQARLVALSLLPTAGPAHHLNRPVLEFNRHLSELARSRHVPFWDVHSVLSERGARSARPVYFRKDGLHLSRWGYATLSLYLRRRQGELDGRSGRPSPNTGRFVVPASQIVTRSIRRLLGARHGRGH